MKDVVAKSLSLLVGNAKHNYIPSNEDRRKVQEDYARLVHMLTEYDKVTSTSTDAVVRAHQKQHREILENIHASLTECNRLCSKQATDSKLDQKRKMQSDQIAHFMREM